MDTLTDETRDAIEASHVPAYALKALADHESMDLDPDYIRDAEDRYMGWARSAREWAEEYIEDSGMLAEMPESLRYYFDADAWVSDACLAGDLTVIPINDCEVLVFHN